MSRNYSKCTCRHVQICMDMYIDLYMWMLILLWDFCQTQALDAQLQASPCLLPPSIHFLQPHNGRVGLTNSNKHQDIPVCEEKHSRHYRGYQSSCTFCCPRPYPLQNDVHNHLENPRHFGCLSINLTIGIILFRLHLRIGALPNFKKNNFCVQNEFFTAWEGPAFARKNDAK